MSDVLIYRLSQEGVEHMDAAALSSLEGTPVMLLLGQEDGEIDSSEILEAALDQGRLAMELKPRFSN